ncbi:hypothetical protein [Streptomyces gilvosporeus]|uniref:PE-PGRS family protein n=1 Tax=Streptomyces gilvosporeus TaxID=553510 RepID=A0A1V0TYX6_9ACTN|nr:hypothetical protein [Streptomyces gilvosporeus]ARF58146.1 hypothetical protein B1H19_31740 [Streptomyces gilvosporeus]
MVEHEDAAVAGGAVGAGPAGPFLREYAPVGPFRHTSARTASVLFYRNGGYSVATVSGIRHHDKRALARPHTVCEIALGTFETTLHMELPAAGGTTFFKAEVDIHWTVSDPHLAATEVVTDVAQRLTAPTLERLREVSTEFPVAKAEQADRAITRNCAGGRWDDLGADLGLRVRLYVRLRVDDKTIHHMDGIRDAHASAELTRVHQNTFRTMLQGGELDQLSYMLAAEPEAAKEFLEKIRQEGRADEKERVDRLFAMVESGQIHSTDVETQALQLLNRGRHSVQGPIGALPARRDTPRLEPGEPEPFVPDWVADEPPSRAGRPSPSHKDEDDGPEPPRRRRSRDDGWSWAEEDR